MYQKYLPILPREQWEGNDGYCGETAMISAGLYYGQYVSQYDARAFASDNEDQSKEGSQLLIGPDTNDKHAAEQMHLTHLEWDSGAEKNAHEFLVWVKQQIVAGFPVAIGVYMNKSIFGDDMDYQPDYDHIVPVIGVKSNHPLSNADYYDDDVIVFSDNGVFTPNAKPVPYLFEYRFDYFQKTRDDANNASAGVYSLATVTGDVKNDGIAITGVITDGSTLPVQLTTDVNYEHPEIADGSGDRPAPMGLVLGVTVSGLEPGTAYKLYRYDSMEKVPNGQFNKNASNAGRMWNLLTDSTSAFVLDKVMSNEVAVFRAVELSAP